MEERRRHLAVVERTTIEVRLRDGWGVRAIARSLGRPAGTISAEITRHGGGRAPNQESIPWVAISETWYNAFIESFNGKLRAEA